MNIIHSLPSTEEIKASGCGNHYSSGYEAEWKRVLKKEVDAKERWGEHLVQKMRKAHGTAVFEQQSPYL
jgi:CRISPR/Cas system endoribonuclease Cas6 (RAMP superfamily)